MKFYDRDLSWLSFNYRVLMEAMDPRVPILERLRFLAIYSSNLDEFFRVRVANIRSIARIDKKKIQDKIDFRPQELLDRIHQEVSQQLSEYGKALDHVIRELKNEHLIICTSMEEIPEEALPSILTYFKTRVAAFLKPVILNESEDLFLNNQGLYFGLAFESGMRGCLNIPSDKLPRFFKTRVGASDYFIFLDDVIRLHLDLAFPKEIILDCRAIKLNKDADLQIYDEYEGNLVDKIEKQIKKRNVGLPSRFLFDMDIDDELLTYLSRKLDLSQEDLVAGGRYHNLNDFFQIASNDPNLKYATKPPILNEEVESSRSLFKLMEKKDLLFHFPYHSYDYILQFFNEAALDPNVTEINVTFYRMAKSSLIGEALISAATNGKKVTVFMEVKARFDEENNLLWARQMKNAGIRIVYSLPGLKVHAKVALVKKKSKMYGFFGTGNLNEKTSEIYCDHGLLSCSKEMNKELSSVFKYLYNRKKPKDFEHLIVSQFNAVERFTYLIDREIQQAKLGNDAKITIKLNNLQEQMLIKKLCEAASEGVEVRMVVRSICCLVPGTAGIKVKRIVDRYLEHARVFCFYNGGQEEVYMGSSDWMNRNLHRRIEVSFPIYEEKLKKELISILELQWQDDVKGVWLSPELENERPVRQNNIRAQEDTYELITTTQ